MPILAKRSNFRCKYWIQIAINPIFYFRGQMCREYFLDAFCEDWNGRRNWLRDQFCVVAISGGGYSYNNNFIVYLLDKLLWIVIVCELWGPSAIRVRWRYDDETRKTNRRQTTDNNTKITCYLISTEIHMITNEHEQQRAIRLYP